MKKLTAFLSIILSFVVCLGGLSPALAEELPEPLSRGITTFYPTPAQQEDGKEVYKDMDILKYDVAIPNPDLSAFLPENLRDFPPLYEKILAASRQKNGTNGSFTQGWFDFQFADAVIPGTDTIFQISDILNTRVYSVVAGIPESQCPLVIRSTAIAFFDNV